VNDDAAQHEQLLSTPDLAEALETDRFKQFLDHLPIAIAVAELLPTERITYTNIAFERLTGQRTSEVVGKDWSRLPQSTPVAQDGPALGTSIVDREDYLGTFRIDHGNMVLIVDAWSNVIFGDDGKPIFRLVALADMSQRGEAERQHLEQQISDKDTLLRELQHRVKNNLQMITALIRLEAKRIPGEATNSALERLAGRVEALSVLYRALQTTGLDDTIDLGVYLSEVAAAVMRAHAVEGIRLDLKVDTWPVLIDVAMPTGLVVNELLTNALKYAFVGRQGGVITVRGLVDEDGCRVIVADNGVGLLPGALWPQKGKMAALIVQALRENAKARITVESEPDKGMKVVIFFARAEAEP
jgi:PAS domain S-box-containing protein